MRSAIFFLFFIILASSSYAYDCNIFSGIDYDNCIALNSIDESLIANIIYKNTSFPNHEFIEQYNQKIKVFSPPNNTVLNNSGIIVNAWIEIVTINPSIYYDGKIYVPKIAQYRSESGYEILVPGDYSNRRKKDGEICQIRYSKSSEQESITWLIDERPYVVGKTVEIVSENYSLVQVQLDIAAELKVDIYLWNEDCCTDSCSRRCYDCEFEESTYQTSTLRIIDAVNVTNYNHSLNSKLIIVDNYSDTYNGKIYSDNLTNILLTFNNSYFANQRFIYSANFSYPPYNFLYLIAEDKDLKSNRNLISSNGQVFVRDASNCKLEQSDFFDSRQDECTINITETPKEISTTKSVTSNLSFLFKFLVFAFILVVIYRAIKNSWGKALIPFVLLILMVTPVSAAEDCGLSNLASCIPQKIYDFFLNMINAPLVPLLNMVQNLLSNSPNITLFQGIWAIIVYCISLLYGLLFVYSGFLFMFSGHDVLRREMAKEWLKNTVIMIVLIQASFYLYGLFVDLGSIMTSSIISMVDSHFFMLTADNLTNVGLELIFVLLYALVLIITLLLLTIRYLLVAFGVLFLPIGIFCYFIPPLRSYGKLILNILGMMIFITFIDAIIILACSMLISLPTFESIKILVMITCFLIIDIIFIMLGKHIISKTSLDSVGSKVLQAGKYIGGIL